MNSKKTTNMLAFDSASGLAVGCLSWALIPFISSLHNWTLAFTHFMAFANIGYGLFSGVLFLLFRDDICRSPGFLAVLVVANGVWSLQCLVQAWRLRNEISASGLGHFLIESLYVGLVACFEARIFFFQPKGK